jgi:hypothetical protein
MQNRIDDYLDGAAAWEQLSPRERADATRIRLLIDEARDFIAAQGRADISTTVLRRIQTERLTPPDTPRRGVVARLGMSLWTAHRISVRPAYVLAITVGAILLLSMPTWFADSRASQTPSAASASLFMQFRIDAPDARQVQLAGSFTAWQPSYELHQTSKGIWAITIPLSVGVHDYAFLIDGTRWVRDPYALQVNDGFGGTNSRVAVLSPEIPAL